MGTIEFLRPIESGKPLAVKCVDDREIVLSAAPQNLYIPEDHIQVPAGIEGLALDVMIARNDFSKPVGPMAKFLTQHLAKDGFHGTLHDECAAELGMLALAQFIVDYPEQAFEVGRKVTSDDLTESRFNKVYSSYNKFLNSRDAYRGVQMEAISMTSDGEHPAIPRLPIAPRAHSGDKMWIIDDTNVYFDTEAAAQAGDDAYAYNRGHIPHLGKRINTAVPVDPDLLSDASSIRTGVVSMHLPNSNSQSGFGVNIISAAA